MLAGLDALVIDLQDVGSRIYTFIYTMANCLIAARKHGVKAIVCDRPNPIGGIGVEGPMLVPGYESFVGQYRIPMRHGMTIGELARLFNGEFGIGAELEVVAMEGWRRDMFFDATGSAVGDAVAEHADARHGGGLPGQRAVRRHERIGRPRHDEAIRDRRRALGDGRTLCGRAMNRSGLPGVIFRPVVFEPTFQKHARTACGGCQMHVIDRAAFRPVESGVALLAAFRAADPDRFRWREPPYEYETEKMPIDILAGSSELREQIEAGVGTSRHRAIVEDACRRVRENPRAVSYLLMRRQTVTAI